MSTKVIANLNESISDKLKAIPAGIAFNLSEIDSFKLAMTFVLITSLLSYLFFLRKVKIN